MVAAPARRSVTTELHRATEQVARVDALVDVVLAQLAHTAADSPRWQRLRTMLRAEGRLQTALQAVPAPQGESLRRIHRCALRWLRREEPTLALIPRRSEALDTTQDNEALFGDIRVRAEQCRNDLATLKAKLPETGDAHCATVADLVAGWGLGALPELFGESPSATAWPARPAHSSHAHRRGCVVRRRPRPRGARSRPLGGSLPALRILCCRQPRPDRSIQALLGRGATGAAR